MSNLMFNSAMIATWQTIYMVFISSLLSIILGISLGLLLFLSKEKAHINSKITYTIIGGLVYGETEGNVNIR